MNVTLWAFQAPRHRSHILQLTMQQAVLHHFPEAQVRYRFNNRSKGMEFNRECLEVFKESVACKFLYAADTP